MFPYRQIRQSGQRRAFLASYGAHGNVRRAARDAGVHRATIYRWRRTDATFALDWQHADAALYRRGQERYEIDKARRAEGRARKLAAARPIWQETARRARAAKAEKGGKRRG